MTAAEARELAKLLRPQDAQFLCADETHTVSVGPVRLGYPNGTHEDHSYDFYSKKGRELTYLCGSSLCWEEALHLLQGEVLTITEAPEGMVK